MIWIAVFPTLTAINLVFGNTLAHLPSVLRTFVLATVAVPIVESRRWSGPRSAERACGLSGAWITQLRQRFGDQMTTIATQTPVI